MRLRLKIIKTIDPAPTSALELISSETKLFSESVRTKKIDQVDKSSPTSATFPDFFSNMYQLTISSSAG